MDGKVDVRETVKPGDVRSAPDGAATKAVATDVTAKRATAKSDAANDSGQARLARMLDPAVLGSLTIDVVAQLGRGTMTIDELARFGSGETVRLDTPLNGLVDLTLNGAVIARGEIVAVDDQFGVRITEVLIRSQ